MTRRTVLLASCLAILIVVVSNLAVGRASRNSVPRQKMRAIDSAGPVIDVLGIGNSLVASGFDSAAIERTMQAAGHPVIAVNAGLGSTNSIEHLVLARRALRNRTVKQIVYGFFDQQMSEDVHLKNSDLIGNHAMLYYEEPQLAERYAHFDAMDRLAFQTYRCCALFRERGNIWVKVEMMRRAMQDVGMPPQARNQLGRSADFDLLEFVSPEEFARRCRDVMRAGAFLSAPVQELFQEARAQGARVTVVEMPMHPWHVKTFYDLPAWDRFRLANRQAVERFDAIYLDASHWIPEERQFQDHIHLGPSGAARFSTMLVEHLRGTTASAAVARAR